MIEITLQVPDAMAERLLPIQPSRLPEVLAYGLGELSPLPNQVYRYVLEFIASRPSFVEMMSFAPTPEMLARVNELLQKNRMGQLTPAESGELDEYVRIDHLITMLKAGALPFVTSPSDR